MKGALLYIIRNCQTSFDELSTLNNNLSSALNSKIEINDINHIGALHRMTQDYLIIRLAGLFDKDARTVSFENFCPTDGDYISIKNENIIKYLIEYRNNFSAHANLVRMKNKQYPETSRILHSNIMNILQKLVKLTDKY